MPPLLRMHKPGFRVLVPLLIKLGARIKRRTRRAMELFCAGPWRLKRFLAVLDQSRGDEALSNSRLTPPKHR